MEYYQLPLSFRQLMSKGRHPRRPLTESVRRHLLLLLTTAYGEYRFDPSLGCPVWEQDFDLFPGSNWKETIEQEILSLIRQQEPRLSDVRVRVSLDTPEWSQVSPSGKTTRSRVGKRISVQVNGTLSATNEPVDFPELRICFSPFSLEEGQKT